MALRVDDFAHPLSLNAKRPGEPLSFAEVLAYNELAEIAPVYIIEVRDPETGPFSIRRYRSGDWHPSPPVVVSDFVTTCTGWDALRAWEQAVREGSAEAPTSPPGRSHRSFGRLAG